MSEYSSLKSTINANVKTNNNQEITGSIMNSVLNAMVNSLGVGYQFMGMATPINPGSAQTPDYKCFYLATTPGTYTNLGGLIVADGEVAILKYDTSWTKEVTGIANAESVSQLGQYVVGATLDLTSFVKGPFLLSNGKWANQYAQHILIPVVKDELITITANSNNNTAYTFLSEKSVPIEGEQPNYADGYSKEINIIAGSTLKMIVPTNAKYMYILMTTVSENDRMPSLFKITGQISIIQEHLSQIDLINDRHSEEIVSLNDLTHIFTLGESPFILEHLNNYGTSSPNNNKNACFQNQVVALKGSTISCDDGYKYEYSLYNVTTGAFIERISWKTEPTTLEQDYQIRIEISDLEESVLTDTSIKAHLHYKLYSSYESLKDVYLKDTDCNIYSDSIFILEHLNGYGTSSPNNNKNACFLNAVLALKGSTISCDEGYKYEYSLYNASSNAFIEKVSWKTEPTILEQDYKIRIEISDIAESTLVDTSIKEHLHYKLYYKKSTLKQTVESAFDNAFDVSADMAGQFSNIIQVIGFNSFVGKKLEIAKPYRYSSWPMLGLTNERLVCVYTIGSDHTVGIDDAIYTRISDNGVVWSAKKCVSDIQSSRDIATGKGNDSNGNMLLLNRVGDAYSQYSYYDVYKTSDGISFNKISTFSLGDKGGHLGDIISVPNVGLVAFFNSYGETRDWGMMVSGDDGVTWTKKNIQTGISKYACPTEISGAYLGDGKLIAIGRLDETDSEHTKMYQMESSDSGENWTIYETNIAEYRNTPTIVYEPVSDKLYLYIYNRANGELEKWSKTSSVIFGNPTNWGEPIILTQNGGTGIDAGNANAISKDGYNYIAFYSGNSISTGIYLYIDALS